MKLCRSCGETKSAESYTRSKRTQDGLQSYCKACYAKLAAARRAAEPERAATIAKRSRDKTRESYNARRRERRAANPEVTKAQRKADYAKYRERELETMRAWKAANTERMRTQRAMKYRADIEASRAQRKAYRDANAAATRAWRMNRIAAQKQATPVWANKRELLQAYEAADMLMQVLGEWYEVDHIVPLRGAVNRQHVVCGLHVAHNLQVVPRAVNRSKSNVAWPDMPA